MTAISIEAIERVAKALVVRNFGEAALLMFNPPPQATQEERNLLLSRADQARADARVAIEAFLDF